MKPRPALATGFSDPVHDAQRSFRAILEAMARPGRIYQLAERPGPQHAVPGLHAAAVAVALTLVDFETPVWLAPRCRDAAEFLRFHCGCPLVETPGAAAFAFAADWEECPALEAFDLGDDDEPARSTTLVVGVTRLRAEGRLILRGPGIARHHPLDDTAIPAHRVNQRAALQTLFPRGVDLILTDASRICAVPRTTMITALMEPPCTSR